MTDIPMDGRYFARGSQVWKAPKRTTNEGGGNTISIGFPVCIIAEGCGAEPGKPTPAEQIAEAMNLADRAEVCARENGDLIADAKQAHLDNCNRGKPISHVIFGRLIALAEAGAPHDQQPDRKEFAPPTPYTTDLNALAKRLSELHDRYDCGYGGSIFGWACSVVRDMIDVQKSAWKQTTDQVNPAARAGLENIAAMAYESHIAGRKEAGILHDIYFDTPFRLLVEEVVGQKDFYCGSDGAKNILELGSRLAEIGWFKRAETALAIRGK